MASFVEQIRVMLWRNYLLKRRGWKATLQELLLSMLLVVVIVLISMDLDTDRHSAVDRFPAYNLSRPEFSLRDTSPILAGPDLPVINNIMDRVTSLLNVTGQRRHHKLYDDVTSEELDELYGAEPFFAEAAVQFLLRNESMGRQVVYGYELRLPWKRVRHVTEGCSYKEGMGRCAEANGLSTECPGNQALTGGLLNLQHAVETALVQTLVNSGFDPPALQVQMMPVQPVRPGTTRLQLFVSITMVIALAPLAYHLARRVGGEREGGHRMMLRIMGLQDSVFWLSWLLVSLVPVVAVSVVACVLVLLGGLFHNMSLFYFFLLTLLYGASLITLAFLMSVVFTKAKTAGAVSCVMTVLSSPLYFAVSLTRYASVIPPGFPLMGSAVPFGGQLVISLCSPVAFALGLDHALFLEDKGGGSLTSGQFPLLAALLMLLLDTLLYGLLAAYLDNMLPSEYRVSRRPWFCFTPSYWRGRRRDEVDGEGIPTDTPQGPHIEPLPEGSEDKRTVRIRDLTKQFSHEKEGTLYAVNGLDLDVCEGQITCVLGHAGAGKTTLVNMLTGTVSPSSGCAYVYNLNISSTTDVAHVSGTVGYCPQHDVICDNLTVEEQMTICARIKGVARETLEQGVNRVLDEMGLTKKRHCLVRRLSGVLQRKLSVAMALLSNSRLLLLDEPSSGLDPASRRQLWGVLQARKQNRVILVTTHHMDEADILADRKAVLSKGRLRCVGSSTFLKQKFGVGYHLSMTLGPNASTDRVLRAVKTHVRGANLERSQDSERLFTIPQQQAWKLAALFKKLESNDRGAEYLGIQSYSIFLTTLEQVFLKLAEEEEAGNVFISPLLTPAADDVFDEEEGDRNDVTRRASSLKTPLPRSANSTALEDLQRRLSFFPSQKLKESEKANRRKSEFPRQHRDLIYQRSYSDEGRHPSSKKSIGRRISSIFTRQSSAQPTPNTSVNFALGFNEGGEFVTTSGPSDNRKRRSIFSESVLKKKKDRSKSFHVGILPKSKAPTGLVGMSDISEIEDHSEEDPTFNGLAMPTSHAARRATVAAYKDFRRSISVQSNMSTMGDAPSMMADPLSKLLLRDSFEQRIPSESNRSARSSVLSVSFTDDSGSVHNGKHNSLNGPTMPASDTGKILSDLKPMEEGCGLEWHRFKVMLKLRFLLKVRHKLSLLLRMLLPVVLALLAIGLFYATMTTVEEDVKMGSRTRLDGLQELVYTNDTGQDIDNLLARLGQSLGAQGHVTDYGDTALANSTTNLQSVLSVLSQDGSQYKMYYNYTCAAALTQLTSLVLHAARPTVTISSASDLVQPLSAWLLPWPETNQSGATVMHNWIPILLLGVSLALTPALFAPNLVVERRKRISGLLRVSGVGRLVYWCSTFLSDFIEFIIGAVLLAVICAVSQMELFEEEGAVLALFLLILLYVPVAILWIYAASFAFNRRRTCLVVLPALVVVLSVGEFCAVHYLDTGDTTTAARIIHILSTVCFPPYICFGAMHYISRVKTVYVNGHYSQADIPTRVFFHFDFHVAVCFVVLGVYMLALPLLVMMLDNFSSGAWLLPFCNKDGHNSTSAPSGDASVETERERVQNIRDGNESWPRLVVSGLSRVFKRQGARVFCVKEASFTVRNGEVLGLLGPHGAGKTTTVDMMIGLCRSSRGTVEIESQKMLPGSREMCRKVGYCPQQDALWNCLTVDEHMDVYAAIRGLSQADTETVRDSLYRDLDLNPHRTQKTSSLSDGDKRKLSVAMSVMGGQSVVLLDEPSAGMDPRARRHFWNAMEATLKGENRCAIVTTHCVEEAEALCSRVAVLVNGEMRCLGSPEELRAQNENMYNLEVRLREADQSTMDMLHLLLKEVFQDLTIVEQFRDHAVFKVKASQPDFSLANTFETLETLKRNLNLEDYSFSQSKLEQVYLDFARLQKEGESRYCVPAKHREAVDSENSGLPSGVISHRTASGAEIRETDPKTTTVGGGLQKDTPERRRSVSVCDAASAQDSTSGADAAVGVVLGHNYNDSDGAGCDGGDDAAAAAPVTFPLRVEGIDNLAFTDDGADSPVVQTSL